MHKSSYREMNKNLLQYASEREKATVVDVGSYYINGSFKKIMLPGWNYTGVDIREGPNVDKVMPDQYTIPVEDGSVDIVVCGNMLHYVPNPFILVEEVSRILVPGGLFFLVAPNEWPQSTRHSGTEKDCFRFLPDGMRAMLEEASLEVLDTYIRKRDCWGIGKK